MSAKEKNVNQKTVQNFCPSPFMVGLASMPYKHRLLCSSQSLRVKCDRIDCRRMNWIENGISIEITLNWQWSVKCRDRGLLSKTGSKIFTWGSETIWITWEKSVNYIISTEDKVSFNLQERFNNFINPAVIITIFISSSEQLIRNNNFSSSFMSVYYYPFIQVCQHPLFIKKYIHYLIHTWAHTYMCPYVYPAIYT